MSQSNQVEAPGPSVTSEEQESKPVQEREPWEECDGKTFTEMGEITHRTYTNGPLASMRTSMDATQWQPLFHLTPLQQVGQIS